MGVSNGATPAGAESQNVMAIGGVAKRNAAVREAAASDHGVAFGIHTVLQSGNRRPNLIRGAMASCGSVPARARSCSLADRYKEACMLAKQVGLPASVFLLRSVRPQNGVQRSCHRPRPLETLVVAANISARVPSTLARNIAAASGTHSR